MSQSYDELLSPLLVDFLSLIVDENLVRYPFVLVNRVHGSSSLRWFVATSIARLLEDAQHVTGAVLWNDLSKQVGWTSFCN